MEKYLKKYHKLFFLAVAVFLVYPSFQKGYIFLLDWPVEPYMTLSDINLRIDSVGWIMYKLGASLLTFSTFQRVFLLAAIYFLGLAGFRLAKNTGNVYARYFSGLLLVFNPFIYARLLEQPSIVLGSGLFFWFLIYFLEYLENNKLSKIIAASLLAALSVSVLDHSIFFILLSAGVLLLSKFIKDGKIKFFWQTAALIFGAILILNFNWIFQVPFRLSNLSDFGSADWEAFQPVAIGSDSVYFTILTLQGYWGEYQDRFISIRENPLWMPAFFVVLILSIYGFAKEYGHKNYLARGGAAVFLLSFILAVGVSSRCIKPLAVFLYENIPFYIGMRDSQKWAAVLLFFYAYFGAWGIKYFLDKRKIENYQKEFGIFLVLVPLVFSLASIRGMHSHFAPRNFPKEWYEVKKIIEKNDSGLTLFFPWHQYAKLDFAGKNVVVPVRSFFGNNVIEADNIEFGNVYSHSPGKDALIIEKYIAGKNNSAEKIDYREFGKDMRKIGIKTILLAKTEDWQKYNWLDTIEEVERVLENDKLLVYKIK